MQIPHCKHDWEFFEKFNPFFMYTVLKIILNESLLDVKLD